ncbi:MAG: hypothetical protein ACKPCO_09420, partial [Actinomycetota bacterium]
SNRERCIVSAGGGWRYDKSVVSELPMWSVVREEYGNVDALRVVETPRPIIADDEILVAVHASSVNPADRYIMMG